MTSWRSWAATGGTAPPASISESALRILRNTRLFTPGVVNLTVTGMPRGGAGTDLRRLGFNSQGFALGSELRRRFGTPRFEGAPQP